ncbi:hypothetical protein KGF57_000285 [Candida theae]|uniref:SUN domain-containing protein n=1 Tax=Candida theae TaxID=1198502 RepID=A0AAD5G0Z0_9ASCO|nr:uncharacterized protein KGF57_000285 [Candida theae]KAI5967801.1 hypothetical protein KGF57_000285 [Candida theae]
MTSAFTKLPRFINDADDEHSIHLKQMIGKSNPIRSPIKEPEFNEHRNTRMSEPVNQSNRRSGAAKYDVETEISMTLNGKQEDFVNEEELNESYLKFINNQYENDYNEDEDDDYVLSDEDTYNEFSNDEDSEDCEYLDYKRRLSEEPQYIPQIESPRLKKTTDHDEREDNDTADKNSIVTHSKGKVSGKSFLVWFVIAYLMVLLVTLFLMWNTKSQSTHNPKVDLGSVNTRIESFDKSLRELQRYTESQLDQINSKFQNLKQKPAAEGDTEKLIYMKHGQVQVSPHFHQFLNSFLDSYGKSFIEEKLKELQPDKRLENVDELKEYVDQAISNSIDEITLRVGENVDKILDGLNIVNDTITTDPFKSSFSRNKVWINSMLEFVSKGSKLVNYADYNRGSRILGFLTSNLDKHNLFQKMWYGWIIFAKDLQDGNNAVHALLDDDTAWQGGDELGVRLSAAIIPTDILIQLENDDAPSPVRVSIGFKPHTKAGFDILKFPKVEDLADHNVNACKFKFIKTSQIRQGINHIKMPIQFVNQQIAGKDIYFKFSHDVKIANIKVYGVSDVNAVRLQDRFKLLVDEFNVDDKVSGLDTSNEDVSATGQDREEVKVYDINDDLYL